MIIDIKGYVAYDVEGVKPRSRPKNTWKEAVMMDLKHVTLSMSDALDYKKWSSLMKGRKGIAAWEAMSVNEVYFCLTWYQLAWVVLIRAVLSLLLLQIVKSVQAVANGQSPEIVEKPEKLCVIL